MAETRNGSVEKSQAEAVQVGAGQAEIDPAAEGLVEKGEASPGMSVRSGAFELTPRGARRYDWRDPYHVALSFSWPMFICVFVVLDLTLNLIFALAYFAQPGSIANSHPGSLADCFFFSLETLATVGYGVMAPATLYGHLVASTEILCGMAFMAIMTGLVFVRFSRPHARILYAANPVVGRFNGKPTLMVRIGNGRGLPLTDATARLGALVNEWTSEGQFYRRIVDLNLNRTHIPLFALTWTLRHEIDEASSAPWLRSGEDQRLHRAAVPVSRGARSGARGTRLRHEGLWPGRHSVRAPLRRCARHRQIRPHGRGSDADQLDAAGLISRSR